MDESILNSVKKALGLAADYTAFDSELIMHINSIFSTLQQLGVGPEDGYTIENDAALWSDFLGADKRLSSVQSYTYLRARLLFDTPTTSFAINAFEKQVLELEWRLNVHVEGLVVP